MRLKSWKFLILLLIPYLSWSATDIELPPEELAKETVLPVFERPDMVRMKNVITNRRFEMGINFGWMMTEPIFDTSKIGVAGYYHTNENSAWGVQFYANSTGLSTYARQLKKQYNLDYNRAPKPEYMAHVDYNSKLFYGKMSVAKNTTINTHLQAVASAGFTKYKHKTYPGASVGMGYKFYFTPSLSLRTDLRLFIHEAPVPFKKDALKPGQDPVPEHSSFKDRIHFTNVLDIGLHYLF